MKYSLVIPAYNSSSGLDKILAVLERTLNSRNDIEVIIIDDCSLKPYVTNRSLTNLKVIKNQINLGVSGSRNIGVSHATGEWIIFLDSDDILLPSAFNFYDEILAQRSGRLAFTFGSLNYNVVTNSCSIIAKSIEPSFYRLLIKNHCVMSGSLVHSSILRNCPFEDDHHEDLRLWLTIAQNYKIHVISKILVVRQVGCSGSISGVKRKSLIWHFKIMTEKLGPVVAGLSVILYFSDQLFTVIKSKILRLVV